MRNLTAFNLSFVMAVICLVESSLAAVTVESTNVPVLFFGIMGFVFLGIMKLETPKK
jgi:hypothetical protein